MNNKKMKNRKRKMGLLVDPLVLVNRTEPKSPPLTFRSQLPDRWFIAVHEGGFGVANSLAKAIRAAQESVSIDDKPTQLALYVSDEEATPTGFVTWANGVKPRLVGLTNTHQGWEQKR